MYEAKTQNRIASIDVMRGLVMIIMVLDHVRDMLHVTSITQSPTDLATTTPALFFTRWVTHLCAPVFVFLSGTSAFISFQKKANIAATRRFLITRGLWLVLMEFTLVNFGLWFDIHFSVFLFNVIATIGCGFIGLAMLLRLSSKSIGVIGIAILATHNLAPLFPGSETSVFKTIFMPFFAPGAVPLGNGRLFVMGYPPIPWLAIMLVGFGCGPFFLKDTIKRKQVFLRLGLTGIALALLLRFGNIYGDVAPWAFQKDALFTFLSFINFTKYPPSLQFSSFFLGLMFLLFVLIEGRTNKLTKIATVYGKVPLFYFIVHWYIIHPIVFAMIFLQGYKPADMVFGFNFGRPKQPSGLSLPLVFVVWMAVVVIMYPICKWYGSYKKNHPEKKWLRYL